MSVFDGLSGALTAIFGAPVTITPERGLPATVRGILRDNPEWVELRDGRVDKRSLWTLQVQKPIPDALQKGATVEQDGRSWRVKGVYPDRSPAADAFMVAELEPLP